MLVLSSLEVYIFVLNKVSKNITIANFIKTIQKDIGKQNIFLSDSKSGNDHLKS